MSRKRLVVISDLGFSCKLRVKQLHLLDIFLYRSTRRILDRVGSIVTLRIRSLQIGGESHESTMDLAQGLNRPRSATAYRFSNGGCNQDENQLKRFKTKQYDGSQCLPNQCELEITACHQDLHLIPLGT